MQCPKCYGEMETVSAGGESALQIDRCLTCFGLFFDQLTRSDLPLIGDQNTFDTGDAELGAEYDDMTFVDCPKCNKMMDQKSAEDPVHIRFEHCTSCYSTFLDAGELRQYLEASHKAEFKALLPS